MKGLAIALAMVLSIGFSGTASANEKWDSFWGDIKEEARMRPAAVFFALPALLLVTPFVLVQAGLEEMRGDEEAEGDEE